MLQCKVFVVLIPGEGVILSVGDEDKSLNWFKAEQKLTLITFTLSDHGELFNIRKHLNRIKNSYVDK